MLNTITLILTLLVLGLSVFVLCKFLSVKKELTNTLRTVNDLKDSLISFGKRVQSIEAQLNNHSAPKIDQSYYDAETNTLVIKGNVEAEGWISAGKNKK